MSGLTITYDGDLITVDARRIDPESMSVPVLGAQAEWPGREVATMADEAIRQGALAVPDGIRLEVYGDDDEDGGGYYVVVYGEGRVGITMGWRDVKNIAAEEGEDVGDVGRIQTALKAIAAEANTALGGGYR